MVNYSLISTPSFWSSETPSIYLNPRLPLIETKRLQDIFESLKTQLPGHVFLTTSGTNRLKLVAITKKAILLAAYSVNRSIQATSHDYWLNPLPLFHISGISIYARAHLSNSKVIQLKKWSPRKCMETLNKKPITLMSLVPTQLYDLIVQGYHSPPHLRCVFVGGAALAKEIYTRALNLGWPIKLCYGMTETAAQIMVDGDVYSHVQWKRNKEGILSIKSNCLLTGYCDKGDESDDFSKNTDSDGSFESSIINPLNQKGWFETGDYAKIDKNKKLVIVGRRGDFVKVGGELVNLQRLNLLFDKAKLIEGFKGQLKLVAVADKRLGFVIGLHGGTTKCDNVINRYHDYCLPFERVVNRSITNK